MIWRGTWDFALRSHVIQAWEDVAHKHGARGLVVRTELLDCRADIKSHGDAIHHLRLSKPAVRPISLQQIRTEHDVHYSREEMRRKSEQSEETGSSETESSDPDSDIWDSDETDSDILDGEETDTDILDSEYLDTQDLDSVFSDNESLDTMKLNSDPLVLYTEKEEMNNDLFS